MHHKYLDNVKLGEKVAVSKGHVIAIKELAAGHFDVLNAIVVNLVRQWGSQVLIQLLQGLQQTSLQS